jgi:hypothetical protein
MSNRQVLTKLCFRQLIFRPCEQLFRQLLFRQLLFLQLLFCLCSDCQVRNKLSFRASCSFMRAALSCNLLFFLLLTQFL